MSSTIATFVSSLYPKRNLETQVVVVGLNGTGKTSWLYSVLRPGERTSTTPTMGFNVEAFSSDRVSIKVWDIAGHDSAEPVWRHFIKKAEGIVLCVDATRPDDLEAAKRKYCWLFGEEGARNACCLVIANKQDLPGALPPSEVAGRLDLPALLAGRHWACLGGQAHNDELTNGHKQWLTSAIQHMLQVPQEPSGPVLLGAGTAVGGPVGEGGVRAAAGATPRPATGSGPAPAATSPLESWLEVVDEPDDEFLEKLEGWSLSSWDHRTHLRLAFLYLQRHGRREGLRRISASIREFIAHSPVAKRKSGTTYHETMTYFWSHMVHFAMASTKPPGGRPLDFKLLLLLNPQLSNRELFLHYYSEKLMLLTPESRTQVVLPDKRPLPSLVTDLAAAAAAAASRQDKAAGGPQQSAKSAAPLLQPAGPPPLPAPAPDSAFLSAFLGRTLDRWNHEALLRGLYCCLRAHGRRRGVGVALDAVRGWEGEAFHTTINYVWIQLLTQVLAKEYGAALFGDRPTGPSSTGEQPPAGGPPRPLPEWAALLAAGGSTAARLRELLADPRRHLRYYSEEVLFSERAAREFVPPDREPLPTTVTRESDLRGDWASQCCKG